MEMNEVLDRLPKHLMDLVIDQPYNEYTPQDHAVWRYVMRRNVDYLRRVAHESYIDGLKKTGISIETIPHMYGMNRILKEIGWAAVSVDGFIPPAAFMEFQAYNVLVIAADIRPIDQIEYTPAPDIIHEAAGHAPIIADPEYAEYLKYFGEIGAKAFSSSKDHEQYEAIRHLSILKADPYTTKEEVARAARRLEEIEKNMGIQSEMSLIRNLHWWTVEYGLIGDLKKPRIYGAGLLSSIGESYSSLQPEVKKLPYSLEAMNYNFDITSQQPQLFVTPDFNHLTTVLDEFADGMALRKGGVEGILKAIESGHTATAEWNSGIQLSGIFSEIKINREKPIYVKTEGPTQISFNNRQLEGGGKEANPNGIGSPAGKLKGLSTPLQMLSACDLEDLKIIMNEPSILEFESGVLIEGVPVKLIKKQGMTIMITFDNCTVRFRDQILHHPGMGHYKLLVGDRISSAYNGPADADEYNLSFPVPHEKTHKIQHNNAARRLHTLYSEVRTIRDKNIENSDKVIKEVRGSPASQDEEKLREVWRILKSEYPGEWLLPLEIIELLKNGSKDSDIFHDIKLFLESKMKDENCTRLISNGFRLAGIHA